MTAVTFVGPHFLGIGAQKAGTTWLYEMLRRHPSIGMPDQKELHFFDRENPHDPAAVEAYAAGFADLDGVVHGEITPSYALLPSDRIAIARDRFPDVRLLFVLRDPVERAWSQAKMELTRAYPDGIPDTVDVPRWLRAHLHSEQSVERGDYAACVHRWLEHYPTEQLRVFLYEEAFADPRRFLQACSEHRGVRGDFYESVPDDVVRRFVYPETAVLGIARSGLPARLPPAFRPEMEKLYAGRVAATEELLGRDLREVWGSG